MKEAFTIRSVHAREILDSRGNPTVEAEIQLYNGCIGRASVPSGASTGAYEAVELRDKDSTRYFGTGVKKAVDYVNHTIAFLIEGKNCFRQHEIDLIMCAADGTENKSKFGANAILAVSLATAKAAAKASGLPLYQYIGGCGPKTLPVPMMNIINGGKHADSSLNIQEFMIMPTGADTFSEAIEWSTRVYHTLKKLLKSDGFVTAVGDEGGFAPNFSADEEALRYIVKAIEESGFESGRDFRIAIDAAATEMFDEAANKGRRGEYLFWKSGEYKSVDDMIDYWEDLANCYPIFSLEDGLAEEDWEGWKKLNERLGQKLQLVGDDLFVTNPKRIRKGIEEDVANSVLVKLNQIGTLSETLEATRLAQKNNMTAVISHRSGETEDVTIADIAVGMDAGQIKTGAPCRTDRVAKYNQLLRIEEELAELAVYAGNSIIKKR